MKSWLFLLLIPFFAHALEVDEKLTVRVLRTSESKKTILVNRGTEDGLVEGDHARFMVTAGIVARAVVVRVSPTRSVWSVYRLVNSDFIVNDAVMSIKITPPVKITKDESQSLVREDVPTRASGDPTALGIPLAEGAQDTSEDALSDADLRALEADDTPRNIADKNWEVFGLLSISSLSASTEADKGDSSYSNSQAFHHIGLGGEYYSRREKEWYSRFSLIASANIMRNNSQAYNGSTSSNDVTEFSFGVNWHPGKYPSRINEFIPFVHASFNIGSVKSSFNPGEIVDENEVEAKGSSNGFSAGFGYKYYTRSGIGFRALLDYYLRNEKYDEDDAKAQFNKSVKGPRLMLGLSYRF